MSNVTKGDTNVQDMHLFRDMKQIVVRFNNKHANVCVCVCVQWRI